MTGLLNFYFRINTSIVVLIWSNEMTFTKLKKFCKDWKWALFLIFVCIAGIPLTTIYGIKSVNWGNDFWPNALSEFLGMFVELIFGAVFTFVVIDKYIQYHKNKQWGKIKSITYKNLYFLMSDLMLKLNLSFPKEMRVEKYILAEDIETLNDYLPIGDFDNFVKSVIENINIKIQKESACDLSDSNESASFSDEQLYDSLVKFKQTSKQDINSLSNLTIPKLLTFSDDIVLLDDLIELEELLTSLLSKIKTLHNNDNNKIKCIWLLKLQEILVKFDVIINIIKDNITLD